MTHRSEITGQHGIVAAGRHYCVAAGTRMLHVGPYAISTGVAATGVNPNTRTLRGAAEVRRERYAFGW
ncbi:MAG: hypothetical protein GKR94_06785 [Gammaproteobacteria bacterium]|nr:hypothetical protein [Gammaproteobacteria bacterium]